MIFSHPPQSHLFNFNDSKWMRDYVYHTSFLVHFDYMAAMLWNMLQGACKLVSAG